MSTLKSKTYSITLFWAIFSVILLFAGLVLAASSGSSGTNNLGSIMVMISILSMLVYVFYSVILWFKFKKGNMLNNLVTAYIILSFLFIIGGLVGAFFTYPDGLTAFLVGLGMMGGFWIIKFFTLIFSKENKLE